MAAVTAPDEKDPVTSSLQHSSIGSRLLRSSIVQVNAQTGRGLGSQVFIAGFAAHQPVVESGNPQPHFASGWGLPLILQLESSLRPEFTPNVR